MEVECIVKAILLYTQHYKTMFETPYTNGTELSTHSVVFSKFIKYI